MTTPSFLFFELLADRSLNPAAVALKVSGGDDAALLTVLGSPLFRDFSAALPCLLTDETASGLASATLAELLAAGCQRVDAQVIERSNISPKPQLGEGRQWLAGSWYLAPPQRVSATQMASRTLALELLNLVAADADTRAIEAIFRQDPILAYHLLRLVNSLGTCLARPISSFSQAIVILGRQQLKRWINLMLFAASRDDGRSPMLLARVAVRARTMELLDRATGGDRTQQEHAFMAGMFSMLGILFGTPLATVMAPLQVNDAVKRAALAREGRLGRLLQSVERAELGNSEGLAELLHEAGVSPAHYLQAVIEAHQWMLSVVRGKEHSDDA